MELTPDVTSNGLPVVPEEISLSEAYGTIVNEQPPVETEWFQKADELEMPLKLILNLPASFIPRMNRVADDSGETLEEWVASTLIEAIDGKVGQAVIKGPSWGNKKKVSGYTASVKRSNGNA